MMDVEFKRGFLIYKIETEKAWTMCEDPDYNDYSTLFLEVLNII